MTVSSDFYSMVMTGADTVNASDKRKRPRDSRYATKRIAKRKCKRKSRIKFVVGNHYVLRTKSRDGSRPFEREFVCKKFIYTMKDIPMNIVIMKQVAGPSGKKFTLDKSGCRDYHIKYEPGLEIFAMEMLWITKKQ